MYANLLVVLRCIWCIGLHKGCFEFWQAADYESRAGYALTYTSTQALNGGILQHGFAHHTRRAMCMSGNQNADTISLFVAWERIVDSISLKISPTLFVLEEGRLTQSQWILEIAPRQRL